jgi:hypothetical protein
MKKSLILLVLILPVIVKSQEEKKFGIQFSGFVKTDIFYDTRQTDDLREGHFLILPKNISKDELGNDINDLASFNFLSIQTRLAGTITGPDVLKAKTGAYIEAEFFGTSNADVNGFRLRHAYALMEWKKSELLIGQYWHPMFITSCFPTTVSFNTGAPFEPFSRNPQIRYTFRFGKFKAIGTALAQRDFQSNGPDGLSSKYLRNSGMPEWNLKLEYNNINKEKENEFLIGAGLDFKTLKPNLTSGFIEVDTAGIHHQHIFTTDETVSGLAYILYSKFKLKNFTFKVQGTYGQLTDNLTMLGGYGVNEIIDPVKYTHSYTPMNVMALWLDGFYTLKKWEFGLFAGYSKNQGFDKNIFSKFSAWGRGLDIDNVYRFSPRIIYTEGKMKFAVEVENTVAAYGTMDIYDKGLVKDTTKVSNLRLLLAVYYMF